MRRTRRLLILLAGLIIAWLAWGFVSARRSRTAGEQAARKGDWALARRQFSQYLGWYRWDQRARLSLAEAFGRDDGLPSGEAAAKAIEQLAQIPDTAREGRRARIQEGRLEFLLLNRPIQAERSLRRAMELDPRGVEAPYLLWFLQEMTG